MQHNQSQHKLPTEQVVHAEDPVVAAKVPIGQDEQLVADYPARHFAPAARRIRLNPIPAPLVRKAPTRLVEPPLARPVLPVYTPVAVLRVVFGRHVVACSR